MGKLSLFSWILLKCSTSAGAPWQGAGGARALANIPEAILRLFSTLILFYFPYYLYILQLNYDTKCLPYWCPAVINESRDHHSEHASENVDQRGCEGVAIPTLNYILSSPSLVITNVNAHAIYSI